MRWYRLEGPVLRIALAAGALGAALILSIGLFGNRSAAGDPYGRVPPSPRAMEIGWRPDDQLVALGERLFFDTRMSGTGRTACASCHDPHHSFAQPRRVSISDNGRLGRRNAPALLDVGFRPSLMWDGKFHALEQQMFGPFATGEM